MVGSVSWDITADADHLFADLNIRDCARTVTLDFSEKGNLQKLDKLIDQLAKFRKDLVLCTAVQAGTDE